MKKSIIWVITVIAVIAIAGFFLFSQNQESKSAANQETSDTSRQTSDNSKTTNNQQIPSWQEIELKDINSQETFKISDFRGKPVLLETFAVWCPFCTQQQKETKKLHEELGDSVISISIDIDPEEDEEIVKKHVEENGFTWRYAISPVEMTQSLIDEFGRGITSAPQVPMVLICPSGEFRKLSSGVKSPEKLKEEIAKC